ncbi:MAG: hypothetical protein AB7H66_03185 [Hyphomonadaceae bacterium]
MTPSGRPEAVFAGRTVEEVQGLIASGCMDRGHMVVNSTPNQVQCQIEMGALQSALTQALIGNSYSTTPQQFVRFVITPASGNMRVQAQMWVQTQMAFGQMQTQEVNGAQQFNSVQSFLISMGGVAPGSVMSAVSAPATPAVAAASKNEGPAPSETIITEPTN